MDKEKPTKTECISKGEVSLDIVGLMKEYYADQNRNEHFMKYSERLNTLLLNELSLDMYSDEYYKQVGFLELGNIGLPWIHADWFAECLLVDENRLENIYGVYDSRVCRPLVQKRQVGENIIVNETTKKNLEDELCKKYGNIYRDWRQILVSATKRLREININIHDEAFKDNDERLRFLHYIASFLYEEYDLKLGALFGNPTCENIDLVINRQKNRNGQLINDLKRGAERAISVDYAYAAYEGANQILTAWHRLSQMTNEFLYINTDQTEVIRVLTDTKKELEKILNEVNFFENCKDVYYENSLFQTFYFKLLEHEREGYVKDQILVLKEIVDLEPKITVDLKDLCNNNMVIYRKDLEAWIEQNKRILALKLLGKERLNKKEKNKLDKIIKKAMILMGWLEKHLGVISYNEGKISIYQISSCFEVVLGLERDGQFVEFSKKYKNSYYRQETKDKKTLSAELSEAAKSEDETIRMKSEMVFVHLINRVYYQKLGTVEVMNAYFELKQFMSEVLFALFKINNLKYAKELNDVVSEIAFRLYFEKIYPQLKSGFEGNLLEDYKFYTEAEADKLVKNFILCIYLFCGNANVLREVNNQIIFAVYSEQIEEGIQTELKQIRIRTQDAMGEHVFSYKLKYLLNMKKKYLCFEKYEYCPWNGNESKILS